KNSLPWASYKDLIKSTDKIEINNTTNFIFPTKIFKNYISDISKKTVKSSEYPLILMPFERPIVADGRGLAYPYVLKGLDGKTLLGNKLWVEINPLTAEKYGISEGSTIDIQSARGEIEDLKVHITKTVAPNVVAIPLGFGHIAFTKYAEGKGVNPKKIMSDEIDPLSGITDWWCTRIKIS
ncbi:MAG: molybdopterin dinucleotide binding domain-containing protein, partial [Spirochaetota bacterium]|nr:molybdopterin dinucleotide binding domain-containing protein [Spirochaetota bacterium]